MGAPKDRERIIAMILALIIALSVGTAGLTKDITPAHQTNANIGTAGVSADISSIRMAAFKEAEYMEKISEERAANIQKVSIPVKKDNVYASLMFSPYHNCYGVGKERRMVLDIAELYIGKIGYLWGAKPDSDNNIKDKLDCSGFTQYVFKEAIGTDIGMGTWAQTQKARQIEYDDLKPGDLGFRYVGRDNILRDENDEPIVDEEGNITTLVNHVGIYYGKDDDGNDLWIHCSSASHGVTLSTYDFNYFFTFFED